MKDSKKTETTIQRKRAEMLLRKKTINKPLSLAEADALKLLHELEVHKIELEMQYEELKEAKRQAAIATDRYIELYDFAPSVALTLSLTGKIEKITLRGAQMLGKERSLLFFSKLDVFVSQDSKQTFKEFFDKVFAGKDKETCHVKLNVEGKEPFIVQIDAIASEDGKHCNMSIIELSEKLILL